MASFTINSKSTSKKLLNIFPKRYGDFEIVVTIILRVSTVGFIKNILTFESIFKFIVIKRWPKIQSISFYTRNSISKTFTISIALVRIPLMFSVIVLVIA